MKKQFAQKWKNSRLIIYEPVSATFRELIRLTPVLARIFFK